MIMSIDQSLSASGVIIWDKGKVVNFTVIKTPPKEEVIIRIHKIRRELNFIIREYNVTHIVIESLPFGLNSTSVRPLAALWYFIQDLCMRECITFSESHVTRVKKNATGKGNAKKQDMIEAMLLDAPELHANILAKGYKKTTGLADLADSYWIYKLYEKEIDDETK